MLYPVTFSRDPLSQVFDPVTRRALPRCYANQGRWVPVRLPRVSARLFISWFARGVDLRASDPWDENLDRYVRGFVRSAYYQHRYFGDWSGMRSEKRQAPWDGLVIVYRAEQVAGQWRVRLMAAPKGDKRLPKKGRKFGNPSLVRVPPHGGS